MWPTGCGRSSRQRTSRCWREQGTPAEAVALVHALQAWAPERAVRDLLRVQEKRRHAGPGGITRGRGRAAERVLEAPEGAQVVNLGDKVKDTITGYQGIATGRSVFLNGCVSICIARQDVPDKDETKVEWFDEQRVELVESGAFKPQPSSATAGGPQAVPPRDGAR